MKHLNIHVLGTVQGVFFRKSAREKALQLGITGYCSNMPDGSVYIEAEGAEENIREFLAWCHSGSPLSIVTKVEASEEEMVLFEGFEIRK